MSIVRELGKFQSACFQIRTLNNVSAPRLRQCFNRFRRLLITRSDDGDFGRNPAERFGFFLRVKDDSSRLESTSMEFDEAGVASRPKRIEPC
jgi:hypothetical protein